jgi:hypothetical protein
VFCDAAGWRVGEEERNGATKVERKKKGMRIRRMVDGVAKTDVRGTLERTRLLYWLISALVKHLLCVNLEEINDL